MYRILVVGYLPGINGIATAVQNLYYHLDSETFQWDFLIPESMRNKEYPNLLKLKKHGARIHYLEYSASGFSSENQRKLKELLLSMPDICGVHVQDHALNIDPLIIADELDLPIKIIHSHAPATLEMIQDLKPSYEAEKKLHLISSDRIIRLACSDYCGDYAFGGLAYSVFPNGVDLVRFSFKPFFRTLIRRSLGIPDNAPVLGFAGTHNERKNPLFALRVFNSIHKVRPNSHMIIVGNGELFDDIKSFVQHAGLGGFTHLLGYQSEMDLFFNAMDLLLFPSQMEGMPYALIEAQTCGLPCLVSDAVTTMVKITPLITMRSLQDSAEEWAEASLDMLSASRDRSNNDKLIADAGYDIRDTAKKMESYYLKQLSENA